MKPIEKLLAAYPDARQSGDGYRATCQNGHRSTFNLSFSETEEGGVLLHCFSGCGAAESLHAVGLDLSDLYPERERPVNVAQARQWKRQSQWRAAFDFLPTEVEVVGIAADQVRKGKPLCDVDYDRLLTAIRRISSARQVICGR